MLIMGNLFVFIDTHSVYGKALLTITTIILVVLFANQDKDKALAKNR